MTSCVVGGGGGVIRFLTIDTNLIYLLIQSLHYQSQMQGGVCESNNAVLLCFFVVNCL